jgi:DnaK suppressor protein
VSHTAPDNRISLHNEEIVDIPWSSFICTNTGNSAMTDPLHATEIRDASNELKSRRNQLQQPARALEENRYGELEQINSPEPHNFRDAPTAEQFVSNASAIDAQLAASLGDIALALERIEQRTYGMCTACGATISKKRLALQPQAPRCIDCQSNAQH